MHGISWSVELIRGLIRSVGRVSALIVSMYLAHVDGQADAGHLLDHLLGHVGHLECYAGVTLVSEGCYKGVTRVFQRCAGYEGWMVESVSRASQGSY
jgi:hypothetical protein